MAKREKVKNLTAEEAAVPVSEAVSEAERQELAAVSVVNDADETTISGSSHFPPSLRFHSAVVPMFSSLKM